jgi:hypothetical protein
MRSLDLRSFAVGALSTAAVVAIVVAVIWMTAPSRPLPTVPLIGSTISL